MEYLARKSEERVKRRIAGAQVPTIEQHIEVCAIPEGELEDLREELKFLSPGPATLSRAEELWTATFPDRSSIRRAGNLLPYLMDHPVAAAFDGKFITMEFEHLFPNAANFNERFEDLQDKILTRYHEIFQHNQNGNNVLIISDFNTVPNGEVPVLYLKGNLMEDTSEGCIAWKGWSASIKKDAKYCFRVLCECFAAFNISCKPEDKQFFLFLSAIFQGVGNLTTTGEKFMISIN
ncbi:uncharacterized protein LOC135698399 [Ochlerotatus camptorhynchus]|uniref:uncharacterized protein LOC135698399 n=1 Tax=Ochlerotatus camptorhynchus TaxID=644619 RepID=UPI0031D9FB34